MSRPVKVGITHGDVNGVGYEVIMKAVSPEGFAELCTPVIFGHKELAEKTFPFLEEPYPKIHAVASAAEAEEGKINLVELDEPLPELNPGEPTELSGRSAVKALETAVEALREGNIDVLVTAPISKEAVQSDKFRFPGHTEYLEAVAGEGYKATMILFDQTVRVALVTTHLPITEIPSHITPEKVKQSIEAFNEILKKDFGKERPTIAVLSLNPHSGDGGLLGNEEGEVIIPVINEMRDNGILAFGPYASDGFFGHGEFRNFDGILAMYHDQGLAPFKTIAGDKGVNFTGGLPFVRTSPDHGTAYGIAWKGEADETSMREAIYQAVDIFKRRKNFERASASPLKKFVHEKPDRGERTERPLKTAGEKNDKPEKEESSQRAPKGKEPIADTKEEKTE